MGFWDNPFSSPSAQDQHNEGQEDGANSDALDRFVHRVVGSGSEDYDRGFENGIQNPSSDDDD